MPSPEYEAASRAFYDCIRDEILAMNLEHEVEPLGSTTVQIGNWKKEADECWALSTQNTQIKAVLEIGLSESSRRLALDARGWLETDHYQMLGTMCSTILYYHSSITCIGLY
ncbi:hypothetical protein V1517DRAFT_31319 [Lipomyces orientalis]|uniref:Uncharacterized protein n=1 Tax=Lipomyces orientalis TaxID=1233043 RepID=A0ACC3TFN7_9ASCO